MGFTAGARRALLAAGAVGVVAAGSVVMATSAHAAGYVPGQFIAKQYTEGLGRIPDQAGWQSYAGFFTQSGCSASTLAAAGESVYTSSEYTGLGYSNAERILTLYRGALNREPDASGFANWTTQLANGLSWPTVVGKFFTSGEFDSLASAICTGAVDSGATSYHFGTQPVLQTAAAGTGFAGGEAALQSGLNALSASGGGTFTLARDATIMLTSELTIPGNVTLTTAGDPDPRHYAEMARLVRNGAFNTGLVILAGGAKAEHVWVDGARDTPANSDPSRVNVFLDGGDGTTFSADKVSDTQGAQSVYALGSFDGYACANATISANLITVYSSDHYTNNTWADGISASCENSTISGNQIVDPSDVGIVVYRSSPYAANVAQASHVTGNDVLSAGNSAYGGMGFDPLMEGGSSAARQYSFAGASISGNTLWSGPNTHFNVGITDGTRAWFAGTYNVDTGVGASIAENTSGSLSARVFTGIGVSGMLNTAVSGNTALKFVHVNLGTCPKDDLAASVTAGTASGTFSPQPVDVEFDGCMSSSQ